ncbi:MAG: hypothetical protein HOO06_07955 [Bdellovibrionaceae bacterium]|nr:hypothetical protein [Pseudobdellovibrionaceae bacterium]
MSAYKYITEVLGIEGFLRPDAMDIDERNDIVEQPLRKSSSEHEDTLVKNAIIDTDKSVEQQVAKAAMPLHEPAHEDSINAPLQLLTTPVGDSPNTFVFTKKLNMEERVLLEKILQAVQVTSYVHLQEDELWSNELKFFDALKKLIQDQGLSRGVILHPCSQDVRQSLMLDGKWICAPSVSEYMGNTQEIQNKKKSLWQALKRWNKIH